MENAGFERINEEVGRLRFRLGFAIFCRFLLLLLAGECTVVACAVICFRVCGSNFPWWYSLLPLPLLLIAAIFLARRRLPARETLLAWFDSNYNCGGLICSKALSWSDALPAVRKPKVSVDCRRELLFFAVSLLFCATAYCVPQRSFKIAEERKLDIRDEVEDVKSDIEVLEENALLPEEKIAEYKEALRDIMEHDEAEDSAKTYEMLDLMEKRLQETISQLQNELVESAMSMEKLSEALEALASVKQSELTANAIEEMAKLMEKLAESDPELAKIMQELAATDPDLSGALAEAAMNKQTLTPEQQKQLAEFFKKNADKIKEKLKRMAEQMKKGNCNKCGSCGGAGECKFDLQSLQDWLDSNDCENACSIAIQCSAGSCAGGSSDGSGGISRGRGDAPLDFTGTTAEFEGVKVDVGLEGAAIPENTRVLNRRLITPTAGETTEEGGAAGNLGSAKTDVKARQDVVHPQHRKAVKQYFD